MICALIHRSGDLCMNESSKLAGVVQALNCPFRAGMEQTEVCSQGGGHMTGVASALALTIQRPYKHKS